MDWNMKWNAAIRLITEQNQIINSLQLEVDAIKSQATVLDWRTSFIEAEIINQKDLINDMKENIHNPSWSTEGVISQPQMVEVEEKSKTMDEQLKILNNPIMISGTIASVGKAAFTLIRILVPVIP
jgi:hypothetical protein